MRITTLGSRLPKEDRLQDAAREFRATVKLRPADVEARFNLGIALDRLGQTGEAIEELSEAVRIRPEFTEPVRR